MHLKSVKHFILSLIFISLTSCATTKVNEFYDTLAPLIEQRDISGAAAFAADFYQDCDKYNKLLYSLELGFLAHLNGDFKESNTAFENAKYIYSMKDYTSTFFNNDTLLPSYYLGEDYEMAYTNFFCALNYLKTRKFKGKKDEAAVEARQLNNLFNKIKIDKKNKLYQDDPFIRYFMGLVYQNAGFLNDAMVSYKLALTAYANYNICNMKVPEDLVNNLYTLYCHYGLTTDAKNLVKTYPKAKKLYTNDNGTLFIINYNGLAPKRVEQIITLSFDLAWDKYYKINNMYRHDVEREFDVHEISAAFPVYQEYYNRISSFEIEATNEDDTTKKYSSKSYFVTNLATILEKHLPEPNYRAVFYSRINRYVVALKEIENIRERYEQKKHEILNDRELSKNTKKRLLENLDRETASNVRSIKNSVNILNKVDLRSWRSLPEQINMATLSLPKGKYNIIIKYLDKNGKLIEKQEIKTKIRKNRNRFVLTNSFKGF
jgi:hypothetical protein